MTKTLLLAAVGSVAITCAASAFPVTFATFSALTGNNNFRLVNSGNSKTRTQDAILYSTTTKGATVSGPAEVQFSFLQAGFNGAVTNVQAMFQYDATIAKGSNLKLLGSNFVQPGLTGTFSFTSETDIVVNGVDYMAGSNLLSGDFSGGSLTGVLGGSSGSTDSSTLGGATVNFTSDFLDFSKTVNRDRGLTLTSVKPVFKANSPSKPPKSTDNGALASFRATVGGQFSSDPAPIITSLPVPEPTAVALFGIAALGLGLVRRRAA